MNYELKSIQPGSVFINAIRIFSVVGFLVAILSFFVLPNENIRITLWWQKIMATFVFTIVYTLVVSVILSLIAWLYNLWTASYSGVKIHLEQNEE
jgi:hypothetical protein